MTDVAKVWRWRRLIAAVVMLLAATMPARAAEISVQDMGRRSLIFISGEIVTGDDDKFNKVAGDIDDAWVMLASPGGLTTTGMEIGKSINLRGYSTVVVNGYLCASACGLIWVSGKTRYLTKSGRVGFHAAWTKAKGKASESGMGNAVVGRYLTLLGLPEKAIMLMTIAGPDAVTWLTAYNYQEFGLDVSLMPDLDLDAQGNPKPALTEQPLPNGGPNVPTQPTIAPPVKLATTAGVFAKVEGWDIMRDDSLGDACFATMGFKDGTSFRIGFDMITEQVYLVFRSFRWQSLVVGQRYPISIRFDDKAAWEVEAVAMRLGAAAGGRGGYRVLSFSTPNARIFQEFSGSRRMIMRYSGVDALNVALTGTAAAADEMVRCQRKADPFAKSP
jgi:hypothetical protein